MFNRAGHNIPSGAIFARELWLDIKVISANDTIYQTGFVNENNQLYDFSIDPNKEIDPDLVIFRTVFYDEKGVELTKFYFSLSQDQQQIRMKARKNSELKYWKLSKNDEKIRLYYSNF